jgi:hypothetical protein
VFSVAQSFPSIGGKHARTNRITVARTTFLAETELISLALIGILVASVRMGLTLPGCVDVKRTKAHRVCPPGLSPTERR